MPPSLLFLDLADELLVQILARLDVQDLISCSLTCHLLHDKVETTTLLQYHIHLALSGAEDCGHASKLTIIERFAELKTQQENRSNLCFRQRHLLPMPENSRVWELFGGVIGHGLSYEDVTRGLAFYELPSPSRGIPTRCWEHPDLGIHIRDFSIDPAQDLAVVISPPSDLEHPASYDWEQKIYLFSMSSGDTHPLATHPILFSSPACERFIPSNFVIQIMANLLGVLIHYDGFEFQEQLLIWDWKTGTLLLDFMASDGTKMESFSFLSLQHFVLSKIHPSPGTRETPLLQVYEFTGSETELRTPRLVRSFDLPRPVFGGIVTSMTIRSDPSPRHPPRLSDISERPFMTALSSHVLAVNIDIFHPGRERRFERNSFVLFVHRSTLLQGLKTGPSSLLSTIHVPWHRWGPEKSRILSVTSSEHVWVCYMHGSRFVTLKQPREGEQNASGSYLRMLDFNPWQIRRSQQSVPDREEKADLRHTENADSEARSPSDLVHCQIVSASQPTTIVGGKGFGDNVTTALPYRDIRSNELFDYRAVMIEEDCLVGLHTKKTVNGSRAVEVLCF